MSSLNEHKSTGSDMLSPKLLKAITPAITPSVSSLFNSSLQQGCTPAKWKEANVTPVFKTGDRQVISNNCPISVLPALAKVLESIVCDQLTEFLEKNSLYVISNVVSEWGELLKMSY